MHPHPRQNNTFTGLSGGYEALFAAPHRFSFNGKESDSEVKGEGNQQDYGMRVYDTRLGRFLSVDPLFRKYAELTLYQFASNSSIAGIDLDGLELAIMVKQIYSSSMTNEQAYYADLPDDRSTYQQLLEVYCATHGLEPKNLPQDKVLVIEYDYTKLEDGEPTISYAWGAQQVEIVEDTRTTMERFWANIRKKDDEYFGKGGRENAYEDVKDVGIVGMKCIGVLQLLFGSPTGYVTLETAAALDNVTNAIDLSKDIVNQNYSEASKDVILHLAGSKVNTFIENDILTPKNQRDALQLGVDFTVDKLKENNDKEINN